MENIAFVFFVGSATPAPCWWARTSARATFKQAISDARRFAIVVPPAVAGGGPVHDRLRAPVLTLFNVSEEVRRTAMAIMVIYGLELCIRNIPYINIVVIFRAGGDT